jgi:hypothetical protein
MTRPVLLAAPVMTMRLRWNFGMHVKFTSFAGDGAELAFC